MRFFSSPVGPNWLWSLPSLLFRWYRAVLSRRVGQSGRGVMLTTDLHIALKLGMSAAIYLLPPVCGLDWDVFTFPTPPCLRLFVYSFLAFHSLHRPVSSFLPIFCFPSYSCFRFLVFISSFFDSLSFPPPRSGSSFHPPFCISL